MSSYSDSSGSGSSSSSSSYIKNPEEKELIDDFVSGLFNEEEKQEKEAADHFVDSKLDEEKQKSKIKKAQNKPPLKTTKSNHQYAKQTISYQNKRNSNTKDKNKNSNKNRINESERSKKM